MRASDRRRERTLAVLGDGYAQGCLGPDTLALRIDAAYRARSVRELRALTADLPRRWRDALRERLERLDRSSEVVVRIAPPPSGPGPWVIGRADGCRMWIDHTSVSRRHAELRRTGDGAWEIEDLGSTNGTWVNGWRVDRAPLGPRDVLHLGSVRVRLR
jgi:hypothetical protein